MVASPAGLVRQAQGPELVAGDELALLMKPRLGAVQQAEQEHDALASKAKELAGTLERLQKQIQENEPLVQATLAKEAELARRSAPLVDRVDSLNAAEQAEYQSLRQQALTVVGELARLREPVSRFEHLREEFEQTKQQIKVAQERVMSALQQLEQYP